jgi:chromosome segregation protein
VELTNFKSFGGTTSIPLLPGFTVVSGPNGSGKSNILDALLFCLGLASSKGMRAERLPDLVNHDKERRGTVEASVTVTFDLSDAPDVFTIEDDDEHEDVREPDLESDRNGQSHTPQSSNGDKPEHPPQEWSVTRRLRVTKQGTYTSTYYINGESCTATELHEQLNRLRVYPEGYNVVLQGDVTSIISMKGRERREIIDELAGVAAFDRKIVQTRDTLDRVKEREDRCHIIESELTAQRDRLAADRIKAEKYQKLRAELQQKQQWEAVLKWRLLQQQEAALKQQIEAGDAEARQLTAALATLATEIQQATAELERLNAEVKALGEEEQLAVASTLATQKAEQNQLETRQQELTRTLQQTEENQQRTQAEIQQHESALQRLTEQKQHLETDTIAALITARDDAQRALTASRERASAIASASEAWVQQQTALTRQIETLLQTLNPQRTEQAQLQERQSQLARQIEEQTQLLHTLEPDITNKRTQAAALQEQLAQSSDRFQSLAQSLAAVEQDLQLQQQTQSRLLSEQRDKQRQLDKLEAQAQAQQEAQGTYATKMILQSGIPGVCGLVAQLGRVDPRYQLALETAAGSRLGNLVVEDDDVAAMGIELLKQKRAGRITFLPLNKIQARQLSSTVALTYARGFIDYAVNLIDCEPRYEKIFAYVFGSTVVFATLDDARTYLGKYRIVTLDGEILESSGAMTGGSTSRRSGLSFGTSDAAESAEMRSLSNRLEEIEHILAHCETVINQESARVKQLSQELTTVREKRQENQLRLEQLEKEIQGLSTQLEQVRSQLAKNTQERQTATERLQVLEIELPAQEAQLQEWRNQLAHLEQSQTPSEWQQIQQLVKTQEERLGECERSLSKAEKQLLDLDNQQQRAQEKIAEAHQRLADYQTEQQSIRDRQSALSTQLITIGEQITQTQNTLSQLEQKLGETKQIRDRAETHLRQQHLNQQQQSWQLEKLQQTQATRREELIALQQEIELQRAELPGAEENVETRAFASGSREDAQTQDAPDAGTGEQEEISPCPMPDAPCPVPDAPIHTQLEQLQKEIRNGQKRLQAMEPVNMLALEEYDRTEARLSELSEKLATLEAERTELLLRIENFRTLRLRAFKTAFDAIDRNFQTIFAELSDGDGYLQLDDPEDPFNGGLNLVAHPKGKPVQRLASMSGGEKSLTALSFIFALQRYRPSPFYAFDEVDMFLDGANVERLARMIEQQAKLAQFIVVSLRRPMIESSERTIGVTQARGAYTQVLGLKLPPRSAVR